MDEFLELHTCSNIMQQWFEEAPRSAFQRYTHQPFEGAESHFHSNANKKMMGFLNKSWAQEKDRSRKHVITERMRRRKQKQNYMSLHELLPSGTKGDKKSILEMAAKVIEEQQRRNEEMRRRNEEMEMIVAGWEDERGVEKAEIKLNVGYPASGIDSMLEVLRCLKLNYCTATDIQSTFSHHEFAAAVEFDTKIRAIDIERAVQRTLFEAEMRFRYNYGIEKIMWQYGSRRIGVVGKGQWKLHECQVDHNSMIILRDMDWSQVLTTSFVR